MKRRVALTAVDMVQPGDVLVIDGGGDLTQALIGGLMRTTCLFRKLGGLVIYGALHDRLEWAEGGLAVFARGHTQRGLSKQGPGEINVPIACAGLAVMTGDLILVPLHRDHDSLASCGYARASLARARLVVNIQLIRAPAELRRCSRAAISWVSCSVLSIRRSRHWPRKTPISISTMLSQLACLGV